MIKDQVHAAGLPLTPKLLRAYDCLTLHFWLFCPPSFFFCKNFDFGKGWCLGGAGPVSELCCLLPASW